MLFEEGSASSTVRILIANDDFSEETETFQVMLTSADPGVIAGDIAIVEIIDTDG